MISNGAHARPRKSKGAWLAASRLLRFCPYPEPEMSNDGGDSLGFPSASGSFHAITFPLAQPLRACHWATMANHYQHQGPVGVLHPGCADSTSYTPAGLLCGGAAIGNGMQLMNSPPGQNVGWPCWCLDAQQHHTSERKCAASSSHAGAPRGRATQQLDRVRSGQDYSWQDNRKGLEGDFRRIPCSGARRRAQPKPGLLDDIVSKIVGPPEVPVGFGFGSNMHLNSPSHADVTARLQAWTDERSRGGSSAAQHRTPSPEDVMQPLMGENIRGLRWSDEPFTFSSRLC